MGGEMGVVRLYGECWREDCMSEHKDESKSI